MLDVSATQLVVFAGFIAWFVLMRVILPRMGVST